MSSKMEALAICLETVELQDERGIFPIRISIVDSTQGTVLDALVTVDDPVVSFNTQVHGISEVTLMESGVPFARVRRQLTDLLPGKIIVGYNLAHQLRVLLIDTEIPRNYRRDLYGAKFLTTPDESGDSEALMKPSLKDLAIKHLGVTLQGGMNGYHDSLEDAKVAMMLYKKFQDCPLDEWYVM